MKTCTICHIEKPLSEFSRNRSKKRGINSDCLECDRLKKRMRRKKLLARTNVRYPEFKICTICKQKLSADYFSKDHSRLNGLHNQCKNCDCNRKRRNKYKLTQEQLDKLLSPKQCAICKTDKPIMNGTKRNRWHIDHCHKTGKVRGLVCHKCNHLVGVLECNHQVIDIALRYISSEGFLNES